MKRFLEARCERCGYFGIKYCARCGNPLKRNLRTGRRLLILWVCFLLMVLARLKLGCHERAVYGENRMSRQNSAAK